MPNTTTGEARHRQSIGPLLVLATNGGWGTQIIEHDGLRQYRFTRSYPAGPRSAIVSAYFEDRGDTADDVRWRFVWGFDHDAPEVPLRLDGIAAALRAG